jgi:hypothetical protein
VNEVPPASSGASKSIEKFSRITLFSAAIIIAGVVGFRYLLSIPPSSVVQADDGFKKAKATIDSEKLRAWALQEIEKYSVTNQPNLTNSEIPNYIQNLYSVPVEDFSVNPKTSKSEGSVIIYWGGGFFHWTMGSRHLLQSRRHKASI